jgi:hypothetical protein
LRGFCRSGARATVCDGSTVTGSSLEGGARARRRASRAARSRAAALARLSELDRRILVLVSTQRVLTQAQLARLLAEVPERTLRYRTERLFQLGLLGRSRPYREAGSHPFHFWPTRQADAFVRGAVPRGGERAEPNPLFLAHAAGLSELYVLLATGAAEGGLVLRGFRREGETREPFRASGRERALAPDALIALDDEDGRQLLAFVELDLGTMSRPRLRVKAAGYAAYVYERAWAQRHPFCPALLFLTTGEARALAFLKLLASELERLGRSRWHRDEQERWFVAAACAYAHEPARALSERCWDDRNLNSGLTLPDFLERARRPYEQALAEVQARRLERERRREELLRNPTRLRRHLRREQRYALRPLLADFGEQQTHAIQLLLEGGGEIDSFEREALLMLVRLLGEQLLEADEAPAARPDARDRACAARLVSHYREKQQTQLTALVRRFGEGPRLREHRRHLEQGELLDHHSASRLELEARSDCEGRRTQDRLRLAYLQRREREARQRARAHGLASYLLHGSSDAQAQVDHEWLRVCERCREVAYPGEHEQHGYGFHPPPRQCHFCDSSALAAWDTRYSPLLEPTAAAAAAVDLRPSAIDGFMDDPEATLDEKPYR